MQLSLNPVELRVLGALVEKEITTPEYYPQSLNALTNACNQKSNRDPVMQLSEDDVRRALIDLEAQSLIRAIAESRATKYEHRLQDAFNFYRPEIAVLCELMLRGPQTPGELRTRASRMHPFEDLEAVNSALQRLARREPPLVVVLPRQAGTKEARYAHLLGGEPPRANAREESQDAPPHAAATSGSPSRIEALEAEVAQLRGDIAVLKDQFAAFRKQFD